MAALPTADTQEIEYQIAGAEKTNSKVRQNRRRSELLAQAATLRASADELTRQIDGIDAAKARAMQEAKWPVSGLGFSDSGVTLNGLPLEQASSAEQLRVSVAIGLAMNPKLKVLLIRDGSLLDEDSLTLVARMAAAAGGQVWCEVVKASEDVEVVIEDGAVKSSQPASENNARFAQAAEFFGG